MKKLLISLLLALTLLPARGQLRLIGNGRMNGNAISDQASGAAKNGQKGILILKDMSTRTVSAKVAAPEKPIGEDGYRLTVTDRNVTLEGEGKGLVYGAVEFLKQYLDIDYWGGGEAFVPTCKELTLKKQSRTFTPTFRYRQSQNYQLKADPL